MILKRFRRKKEPKDKPRPPAEPPVRSPMDPICPYCGYHLDTMPKRKKKCRACSEYIYVRTKQSIYPSPLLTEADARAVDWARDLVIAPETFKRVEQQLSKQFGHDPEGTDVIWRIFNESLKSTRSLGGQASILYQMALFLNQEGREFGHLLEQRAKRQLMDLKARGTNKVEILDGGGCDACRALRGKKFTIKKALDKMPIPNKKCTHILYDPERPFCRCEYVAVLDF